MSRKTSKFHEYFKFSTEQKRKEENEMQPAKEKTVDNHHFFAQGFWVWRTWLSGGIRTNPVCKSETEITAKKIRTGTGIREIKILDKWVQNRSIRE